MILPQAESLLKEDRVTIKPLHVLQTPARIYEAGGVESYVWNLSVELSRLGHSVKVLCSRPQGKITNQAPTGVDVRALHSFGKVGNTNITPALLPAALNERFDIVHTHIPTPWSADWSMVAAAVKRSPLVLTYHNDLGGRGIAGLLASAYNSGPLKLLLKQADRIIVARREHLSPLLEGYLDKIEFVPVGVDDRAFRPAPLSLKVADIFFLSVLDEHHRYKGLDVLIKSLKLVKQHHETVRLVVGGVGSMSSVYAKLAAKNDLQDNVEFIGAVPSDKLAEIYNCCSIFVLPSTDSNREGFGIVPLEAMACGRPVVVTEVAGVARDVRAAGAGSVVASKDHRGLADALIGLLEDEGARVRSGAAGRRLVEEKYAWRLIASRIAAIYEDVWWRYRQEKG
jgi:glycosyltransferase involved in cell wall biosynthesis